MVFVIRINFRGQIRHQRVENPPGSYLIAHAHSAGPSCRALCLAILSLEVVFAFFLYLLDGLGGPWGSPLMVLGALGETLGGSWGPWWGPWGSMGALEGSLGDLGGPRRALGSPGGPWVGPLGLFGVPLGLPWGTLGVPWGTLGGPCGGTGDPRGGRWRPIVTERRPCEIIGFMV